MLCHGPYVAIAITKSKGTNGLLSAQHPFMVRHDSLSIRRRSNSVRVIVPYIGGGYGSKSYTKIEPLAAACSRGSQGAP